MASATYRTLPILKFVSTGLLVFDNLLDATRSVPELVANHLATVELLDATSIRVAQRTGQAAEALAAIDVREHATLLVEFQGNSEQELTDLAASAAPMFDALPVVSPVEMTSKLSERNALWAARRGLYTTVAGNRPTGTNALLEDVVVPVDVLGATCRDLTALFDTQRLPGLSDFWARKRRQYSLHAQRTVPRCQTACALPRVHRRNGAAHFGG